MIVVIKYALKQSKISLDSFLGRVLLYLSFLGGVLFLLSYFIFNSPTFGGQIFFYIWLVSGVLCIVIAVITYFQILNHNTNEITN